MNLNLNVYIYTCICSIFACIVPKSENTQENASSIHTFASLVYLNHALKLSNAEL